MPLSAERQSGAGPEIRLQAALVRTADGATPKLFWTSGAPAVLAGDFNVMPTDLDVYAPERWVDDALFRPEVREAYRRLVAQGWTDALRALHPDERIYTFWKYFRNAFARDAGLRIDHLLLSPSLAGRLVAAGVDRDVRAREHASDHAPVWIELADANAGSRQRARRRRRIDQADAPSIEAAKARRGRSLFGAIHMQAGPFSPI